MQTLKVEFKKHKDDYESDKDLVAAYCSLLCSIEIEKGSVSEKTELVKELKLKYKKYSDEDKDNKTSFDLWLEDAQKCYGVALDEYNTFLKAKKRESVKDHYNYKIPLDLYNAKKEDFETGKVEELVKEGNLFIRGKSDTGKSHLAVAVLRGHIDVKPNMRIEMFYEDDFHEMNYEESQREIKRLKRLDGIVFDDLGAIGLGPDKRNLIKGLIYSLFRNAKLCLICTNCEIDELYDSRTGSKIVGGCTIINKTPTGTRKKNKKEITI